MNKILSHQILQEKEEDPIGIEVSNISGWHSQDNFHKKEEYRDFINIVSSIALTIAKEMMWQLDQVKPVVNNCWAMVNQKNSFNVLHHHPNSILSGVYYVKVPENSGNIYFYDPRSGSQMLLPPFSSPTLSTIGKITYKPTEGLFIIFPSWLWHGVEPNQSEESRISLSFNIGTFNLTNLNIS